MRRNKKTDTLENKLESHFLRIKSGPFVLPPLLKTSQMADNHKRWQTLKPTDIEYLYLRILRLGVTLATIYLCLRYGADTVR